MISDTSRPDLSGRILTHSLEELLLSGGDSRTDTSHNGLDKYGCAPRVRAAVAFGNCTASSLSEAGRRGALDAHDRLRVAARSAGTDAVVTESEAMFSEYRARIRELLRLQSAECEIVFCPSGTDAELLVLALARGGAQTPFLNIVTGPSEVGGGTIQAAAGRHFNRLVPSGTTREIGSPVDSVISKNVLVKTVRLRDEHGRLLDTGELDRQADVHIGAAIKEGADVLLHVVTHSKTGAYAPSFDKAAEFKSRYGDRLTVVLDAAQGRLSRKSIGLALDLNYIVLLTGSKFYGGPPFCGLVLVPRAFSPQKTQLERLSQGMHDYFTAPEMPQSWTSIRRHLPALPNPGLVLRWAAALTQMEAYYAVPYESRREIVTAWEEGVVAVLGQSSIVNLVPVDPIRESNSPRYLEAATTVFPFFVTRDAKPLDHCQLSKFFRWLNHDMSGSLEHLSVADKAVLARPIHVGQPVLLSGSADDERSVLRIALGGPMVVQIAQDKSIGESFETRLRWLHAQFEILTRKIEILVKSMDELEEIGS